MGAAGKPGVGAESERDPSFTCSLPSVCDKVFTQTRGDGDLHCLKSHLSVSAFNCEKGGGCAPPKLFLQEEQFCQPEVPAPGDAAAYPYEQGLRTRVSDLLTKKKRQTCA